MFDELDTDLMRKPVCLFKQRKQHPKAMRVVDTEQRPDHLNTRPVPSGRMFAQVGFAQKLADSPLVAANAMWPSPWQDCPNFDTINAGDEAP